MSNIFLTNKRYSYIFLSGSSQPNQGETHGTKSQDQEKKGFAQGQTGTLVALRTERHPTSADETKAEKAEVEGLLVVEPPPAAVTMNATKKHPRVLFSYDFGCLLTPPINRQPQTPGTVLMCRRCRMAVLRILRIAMKRRKARQKLIGLSVQTCSKKMLVKTAWDTTTTLASSGNDSRKVRAVLTRSSRSLYDSPPSWATFKNHSHTYQRVVRLW